MRRTASTILFAALAAAPAFADAAAADLAKAETFLAQAERQVRVAESVDGALPRLRALQRAKPRFTWARQRALHGLAEESVQDLKTLEALASLERKATRELVKILNAETAHYLAGDARDLARRRNEDALELAPDDVLALELKQAIENPPTPPVREPRRVDPADPPRESGDEYWLRRRPPFVRLTPYERRLLERRGLLPGFPGPVPAPVQPPAPPTLPRIQAPARSGGLPQAPLGGGAARSLPSR